MPALSDYTAGTITLTNGSNAFTGTGTGWLAADFREGDTILGIEDHAGVEYVIATIDDNGEGTLTQDWQGATGTYTYRMRYLADGARVTAQARNLIELLGNGNLTALAGLTGPGVPVFNGPHAMVIKPESDFVNGVAYDVQVDTLSDRDAYDGQSEGFAVLVSDVGDGRSALYSKVSNASADWSDPAYVTGPVGPIPDVEATVDMLPPGSAATVTPTPITGGVRLDFELPEASGFYNAGIYDIAEPYDQDDVVRHNGSSFIALQPVPIGESPSSAFPPVDTAYWQVLAAKGQDGTGTGDVVGPSGAVADRIAVFDGTTGKLIKDSGSTISDILSVGAAGLCNGRLTLTSGVPVPATDVTAAGTLYFTPYRGNAIALYNGSAWVLRTFSEVSIALSDGTASRPNDVFAYDNAGTLALELVAWTNDTTRATALALQDGVWVKSGAATRRFLGTVMLTGSKQGEDSNAARWVWNAQNRVARSMRRFETTSSWSYTSTTFRIANGSAANCLDFVRGLDEDAVEATVQALASSGAGGSSVFSSAAIGLDTASPDARSTIGYQTNFNNNEVNGLTALWRGLPGIGRHRLNWLERSSSSGSITWYGLDGSSANRMGIVGSIFA